MVQGRLDAVVVHEKHEQDPRGAATLKRTGLNWSLVSTIAVVCVGQEGFNEPVLARLTQGKHSGRFIVLMRTGRNNPIYQTESDDEGRSWTKLRALGLLGVDPDLIEMTNGILVCGFGGLTEWLGEGRHYLAFSLDQGATWTRITQVSMYLEPANILRCARSSPVGC